jgi:hypothetical protein
MLHTDIGGIVVTTGARHIHEEVGNMLFKGFDATFVSAAVVAM